jgi:hypothetical protein
LVSRNVGITVYGFRNATVEGWKVKLIDDALSNHATTAPSIDKGEAVDELVRFRLRTYPHLDAR